MTAAEFPLDVWVCPAHGLLSQRETRSFMGGPVECMVNHFGHVQRCHESPTLVALTTRQPARRDSGDIIGNTTTGGGW